MPLDREYFVAAYCGMLHAGVPTDAFIAKYGLSETERRRAAITAIQMLMQRFYTECYNGDTAVRLVRSIAAKHRISNVELEHMAWEVLRGTIETSDVLGKETADEIITYVVRHFLADHLPVKTRFGFYDHHGVFQPRVSPPKCERLIDDAACHNVDDAPVDQYPPEALELLRDAGLKVGPEPE